MQSVLQMQIRTLAESEGKPRLRERTKDLCASGLHNQVLNGCDAGVALCGSSRVPPRAWINDTVQHHIVVLGMLYGT